MVLLNISGGPSIEGARVPPHMSHMKKKQKEKESHKIILQKNVKNTRVLVGNLWAIRSLVRDISDVNNRVVEKCASLKARQGKFTRK